MSPRLAFAIDAVHRAGRSTLGLFQAGVGVDLKADRTPVTDADRNAEQLVRDMLAEAFPEDAILGEEQGGELHRPNRWIIDPIDGTKSFVSGVPLYATLLSYEENGQPIVGACYFPALHELLYAEVGGGTFWNGRPVHVSDKNITGGVVCCGGHKSMDQYGRSDGINALAKDAMATRTWSDAYGHALVATGRAEAMLDPVVSRWDVSAMILIVREAGGRCSTFAGTDPLAPAHPDGGFELVSSNGIVHEDLLRYFTP